MDMKKLNELQDQYAVLRTRVNFMIKKGYYSKRIKKLAIKKLRTAETELIKFKMRHGLSL